MRACFPTPISPYAVSKLAGEHLHELFYRASMGWKRSSSVTSTSSARIRIPRRNTPACSPSSACSCWRQDADHLRRRQAEPRLHLHRERRQRQPAGHGRPGGKSQRTRLQRRRTAQQITLNDAIAASASFTGYTGTVEYAPAPRRHRATPSPTSPSPAKPLGYQPPPTSTKASPHHRLVSHAGRKSLLSEEVIS